VAVLSAPDFDALQVDMVSVKFGPNAATTSHFRVGDANADGLPDLLLRFENLELGITCGLRQLQLTGRTYAGQEIYGSDFIRTVSCAGK
jgi:hypothetical protein